MYLIKQVTSPAELKPGFHMIVRITLIATVVSRRSGSFDMIVSIASIKGKRRGLVSDVSG